MAEQTKQNHLAETLVDLLSLATALEGEGQYNNAKLLRASAEGLARRDRR
jgi:hypothetical protein